MSLAADVSRTGLALGVEGIEVLLESMVGRDARIDRASPGGWRGGRSCARSSPHGTTSLSLSTPDIPACSVGRDRRGCARHRPGSGEAEESRPVPVAAGDRPRDLGEAAVGLAVPDEALLQRHDAMETAIPFANQDGAWFDPPLRLSCPRRTSSARLRAAAGLPTRRSRERPQDGVGKIA